MNLDMPYYEQLLKEKEKGVLFSFDEITKDQLLTLWDQEHLSDALIGELFGVSKNQVVKKRKGYGITLYSQAAQHTMEQLEDEPDRRSALAKEALSSPALRGRLAVGLTRYVFRDGPVEDMHAAGQLSQADMKTLNQFTANRIATVLYLAEEGYWEALYALLGRYMAGAESWDEPQVDLKKVERLTRRRKAPRGD